MGTATVPSVDAAASAWCTMSGYEWIGEGASPLEPGHGELWDVDLRAHARAVVLRAPHAERGFLRLVATDVQKYEPDVKDGRTPAGPFAYEFLSCDVDEATERARAAPGFRVVGGPLDFDNGPAGGGFARASRVVAPGGFTCLFNTIKRVPAPRILPQTPLLLSPIWNSPMTAGDRAAVERFYGDFLGMTVLLDGVLDSDSIRETNQFPAGWAFDMLVYSAGAPMQMIEIEIHPSANVSRPQRVPQRLLRGNAITTLMVEDLTPLLARGARRNIALRGPVSLSGFPYRGRRVAAVDGPNGEMFELVEVGAC